MPSGDLVKVTWRDAYFDLDEVESHDCIVDTVGWLLDGHPGFLHVAAERTPDGFRAVTHIPLECFQSQTTLSEGGGSVRSPLHQP